MVELALSLSLTEISHFRFCKTRKKKNQQNYSNMRTEKSNFSDLSSTETIIKSIFVVVPLRVFLSYVWKIRIIVILY